MGCTHCDAAGKLKQSLGIPFTDAEEAALDTARLMFADGHGRMPSDAELQAMLHQLCRFKRQCTCQHGNYWEQDPDGDPDVPAYLDALRPDDPRRMAYEAHVGRKIP